MFLLDINALKIGDIILIRSESRISQMVRRLTKSQYSHAILYVGNSSVIDSDGYGVQSNNLQRILIEKEDDAVIMRIKDDDKKESLFEVEVFARQKIGTEYSTDEAKIATISKELEAKEPNRQFCTRFIAQAYESAGIKLVENANYCVPEDILNSPEVAVVKGVLRQALEKEIEFANSENPLVKQREIHNSIFRKARELSGQDIQTFEQVNDIIIRNPDIDSEMTDFVRGSGYLTMTEDDMEKNPWHYDAEKMFEHYQHSELIFNAAMFYATTEEKSRERINMTIYSLIQLNKEYPRKYFKMQIELYRKLLDFSYQRQTEALRVLKYF